MTYLFTNERGETKRKILRNCDRCSNIQDAKGKFNSEVKIGEHGYWRSLAEWLMENAK